MNELEKLKPIKPSIEIVDYTPYIFAGLGVVALAVVFYLVYLYFKNRKKQMRTYYLHALKTVDMSDTKNTAYRITEYSHYLATTPKQQEFASNLNANLERYKYKKEVPAFDEKTLDSYRLFVKVLDDQH